MNNPEFLQELAKRIKEGQITIEGGMISKYACDYEGATELTTEGYCLNFFDLLKEIEIIEKQQQKAREKEISEQLKIFSDNDLENEINNRKKQK